MVRRWTSALAFAFTLAAAGCGGGESTTATPDVAEVDAGAVDAKTDGGSTGDVPDALDASADDVIDAGSVDAGSDAAGIDALDASADDVIDAAVDAVMVVDGGADAAVDGGGDGGVAERARAGRALVSAGGVMRSSRYRMVSTMGRSSASTQMRSGRFVLRGGLVGTIGGGR